MPVLRAGRGGRSAGVFSAQKERQLNRRVDADDGSELPFFMFGIYEKNGQPLETVLRQNVETKWLRPRRRPYETDNTYAALEREMRLRKEVKALEEQAKKAGVKLTRAQKKKLEELTPSGESGRQVPQQRTKDDSVSEHVQGTGFAA